MAGSATRQGRIVHVLNRLSVGGMERVALTLIERTNTRYQHQVICLHDAGELADELRALGVPVMALNKRAGKDWLAYKRLYLALRACKADIVHTYNIGTLDVGFWARLAGVRRVVHAEHGLNAIDIGAPNRKYKLLRRGVAYIIDAFIPVSSDLADWLVDEVGVPKAQVVLIRNGIDTDHFKPQPESTASVVREALGFADPPAFIVGTVGRLDPVKGFDTLITAFGKLIEKRPDLSAGLVIAGDGPERERLEAQILASGLIDRVLLLGNRGDIDILIPSLDAYVCSSISEGIALTLLEAMASERPIVATDTGGNPELIDSGKTGLLVPVGAPTAMADAIFRLLEDPAVAGRLGAAARDRVRAEFSIRAMQSAYEKLYDRLLPAEATPCVV